MRDLLRALPLDGTSLSLLLSVSAHAALALAWLHSAPRPLPQASPARQSQLELVAVEPTLVDASADLTPTRAVVPEAHDSRTQLVRASHSAARSSASLPDLRPASSNPVAAPEAVDSASAAAPRFAMTVPAAPRAAVEASALDGRAADNDSGASAQPVPEASVDTAAKLLDWSPPSYTREAEAAGIEAVVPLEIVVDRIGAVVSVRSLSHVGYGLDEAALRAVRAYRFSPARRAGKALAVRMRWLMRFQLR